MFFSLQANGYTTQLSSSDWCSIIVTIYLKAHKKCHKAKSIGD